MDKVKKILHKIFIDGLSGMATGLFATLIIGTIIWLFVKTDKMMIFVVYTAVVGIALIVVSVIEISTGTNLFTGAPISTNIFPVTG